jgi:hypothetical protein
MVYQLLFGRVFHTVYDQIIKALDGSGYLKKGFTLFLNRHEG